MTSSTLCLQSATGRTGAIDKMLDNQLDCFFWGQLLQWHNCLEQLSYVSHRHSRQHCHFQLMRQFWVSWMLLRPIQLSLCRKPQRQEASCAREVSIDALLREKLNLPSCSRRTKSHSLRTTPFWVTAHTGRAAHSYTSSPRSA